MNSKILRAFSLQYVCVHAGCVCVCFMRQGYLFPRGAEDAEVCVELHSFHWLHLARHAFWSEVGF